MQLKKGQIGIETLAAVSLVILFFMVAMVVTLSRDATTRDEALRLAKESACSSLASQISAVSSLSAKGSANSTFSLSVNTSIHGSAKYADMAGYICAFCCNVTNGTSSEFNITAGWVSVLGNSGSVVVRNA